MFQTKKRKYNKIITWGIKAFFITGALFFIYKTIQQDWSAIQAYFVEVFSSQTSLWLVSLAILGVPLNWGLETVKWHRIIQHIEPLPFKKSMQATLTGLTVSLITPNRTGEFAGRMLYVKPENRFQGAFVSVICSIGQLSITVLLGAISAIAYIDLYKPNWIYSASTIGIGSVVIVVLLLPILFFFLLQAGVVDLLLDKWKHKWSQVENITTLLHQMQSKDYSMIIWMSFLRYGVYCLQFYVLLLFFQSGITSADAVVFIPINFLGITAIPSIALAELGVREAIAVGLINQPHILPIAVLCATFSLWFINLAIPALSGVFFVARAKIFADK